MQFQEACDQQADAARVLQALLNAIASGDVVLSPAHTGESVPAIPTPSAHAVEDALHKLARASEYLRGRRFYPALNIRYSPEHDAFEVRSQI